MNYKHFIIEVRCCLREYNEKIIGKLLNFSAGKYVRCRKNDGGTVRFSGSYRNIIHIRQKNNLPDSFCLRRLLREFYAKGRNLPRINLSIQISNHVHDTCFSYQINIDRLSRWSFSFRLLALILPATRKPRL